MFGYFVIGLGILAVIYVIAAELGYKRYIIRTYGKDFWERSGK